MTARKVFAGLALALLAFGATKLILAGRWYRIPQNGMYPGLPAGSYLLVRPHAYRTPSDVRRGDVIVFERTENAAHYIYIWRVVGLPGDSMQTAGPRVAVNGHDLPRQLLRDDGAVAIFLERNGEASYEVAYPNSAEALDPPAASLSLQAGQFFVLGDNRYNARDSRYFGPVSFEAIMGKKLWAP
jgi:signal peptidase I